MGALDRVFRSRRPSQERPLASIIAGLWRNDEQGVWYDVEGFRDSWNSVGTNFLVNGGFDTANGWIVGTGWTISDGIATFNNTSGATQSINRSAPSATGKWYLIEFDLGISNGSVDVAYGGSSAVRFSVSGRCRFLHYRINNYGLYFYALNGAVGSIDNITIKEWFGLSSCALYQDAAGALPVYMPGQGQVDPPVGLLLDKRKGLVRGPELLVNGDFSAGATSWDVSGADATHIATFSNGALRYQSDTTSPVLNISQAGVPIVAGKWYEVTVAVSSWTSGGLKTDTLNGNSAAGLTLTQGPGTYRVIGLATATTSRFGFSRNSTNVDLTIDSISVRELLGNHAYQTTTTSRPTLSAKYNLLTYSEQFDAAAWAKVECAVSPNVALGPNGVPAGKMIPSANAAQHYMTCSAGTATESRTAVVVAKADGISKVTLWPGASATFAHFDLVAGTTSKEANVLSTTMRELGDGWYELRVTWASVAATSLRIYASGGSMGAAATPGDGVAGILLERADLRPTGDGIGLPAYQRVADAGTYDTAGFPLYLRFDGVDDSLLTGNIDLTAFDKVLLSLAAQKQVDANCVVVEFGSAFSAEGCFGLQLPNSAGAFLAAWGTGTSVYKAVSLPAAPHSAVFSAYLDRAKNAAIDAVAVLANSVVSASPGFGTPSPGFWGNNPLYIGRRTNSSLPFKGRLYGLFIRAGFTANATIAKVERHLNSKARAY